VLFLSEFVIVNRRDTQAIKLALTSVRLMS